jgi:hypothetical protein
MPVFSNVKWPTRTVIGIGALQLAGFITQIDWLRDVGRLTTASPLPLVFSDFRGLETFSLEFNILAESKDGSTSAKTITPELYGQFKGPYNRRNVYGAALAYGPKLTGSQEKSMVDSVLKYGFCGNGPLTPIFALSIPPQKIRIYAKSKARGDGSTYSSEVRCP